MNCSDFVVLFPFVGTCWYSTKPIALSQVTLIHGDDVVVLVDDDDDDQSSADDKVAEENR